MAHELMADVTACTIPPQEQAAKITTWMEEGLQKPDPVAEKLLAIDNSSRRESIFSSCCGS